MPPYCAAHPRAVTVDVHDLEEDEKRTVRDTELHGERYLCDDPCFVPWFR